MHLRPGYNFALASHGGTARGGQRPEVLIDGIITGHTGGEGFAHTIWSAQPRESMLVEFKEPSKIDCVRFLLWDLDDRYYRYKLEYASDPEQKQWTLIADKTSDAERCSGWQLLRFPAATVKSIRLTGTFNSSNSGFHVVELEACIAPPNGFPKDPNAPPPSKPPEDNLVF